MSDETRLIGKDPGGVVENESLGGAAIMEYAKACRATGYRLSFGDFLELWQLVMKYGVGWRRLLVAYGVPTR